MPKREPSARESDRLNIDRPVTALYVVDTNVVVSALIGAEGAPPALIVERMLSGHLRYLLSTELLAEYRAVLLRPRLVRRHGLNAEQIDLLLTELTANASLCEPTTRPASPDPNDAHLLALLEAQPRAVLLSGDALTVAAVTTPERAMTPRQWLDRQSL